MSAAWRDRKETADAGGSRQVRGFHYGCLAIFVALGLTIVRSVGWRRGDLLGPLVIGELVVLAALILNHLGYWSWAARLVTFGVLVTAAMLVGRAHDGFRSIIMLCFPGLLVIAVMLHRAIDYLWLSAAVLLTVTGLGVAEIRGVLPTVTLVHTPTDYTTVFFIDLILVVIAVFGGILARNARLNLADLRGTVDQLASANRELARSEAMYRSFVELAVDAIFVVNGDGTIAEVNRQASVLTGMAREQLLNASMMKILSPIEPKEVPLPLDALARGVPIMRPYRIGRPDGSAVEAEIHAAMLPEGLILCFCRDIADRKQAEADRKHLQAQLVQAQKMESMGRLAGGVAHDFNNLLTVINGYSRMLLAKLSQDDPKWDSVNEIHLAGQRAGGLTQQLLAFSRQQIQQPRVLDFNAVVRELHPMLTRLVGEDVELCVNTQAEAATVYADPNQLVQVVMNLTVNARDAMPRGGKLLIETAVVDLTEMHAKLPFGMRPGPYAILAVSDNGTGMDEETRQQIFEPFFTTKGGKGTGLGLSMTHGIVEQSGGHIEVESALDRGTTFRVYLPAVVGTPGDIEVPQAVPVATPRGTETVLVVEDQTEVRDYTADALSSYGYHVIPAGSAAEALLLCDREGERIDLVLTDVVMPNLSGKQLADRLAQTHPGIKVLFMSGYTDNTITLHGVLQKDVEFIQKPFSPDQLAIKVRELLG